VVRRGGRPVVRGIADGVVGLLFVSVVPVVAAMEAVRDVAGRARGRVVAEQVPQQPPQPVHRKGL
jgi:hypothetical protein